jgi:hypothetical protein
LLLLFFQKAKRLPLQGVIDHPWIIHHCGESNFQHRLDASKTMSIDSAADAALAKSVAAREAVIKCAADREM